MPRKESKVYLVRLKVDGQSLYLGPPGHWWASICAYIRSTLQL